MQKVVIQVLPALKNDQCTCLLLSQRKNSIGQIHNVNLGWVVLATEEVPQKTETVKCLTYFPLEDDNQEDEENRPQFLEYPTGHEQPQVLGNNIEKTEKAEADYHL